MARRSNVSDESLLLRLEGAGWLAGWRLARALPEKFVYRVFERSGARSYRRNARRRARVIENLLPIVGPERVEEAAREAFRWYGRYWAETFRMQDLSREDIRRRVEVSGAEHIQNAVDAGRGCLLATPHYGNWDAGGRWVADNWGLAAVVEVLRPRALFERFCAHRRALGIDIIPLERGGDATAKCLDVLRAGRVLALVADRDLGGTGVEVEFFGRRTKMPAGPAVLAMRSGAPLIPAAISQREDRTWFIRILEPCEVPDANAPDAVAKLTRSVARAFEQLIAEAPAQWHAFNKHWIDEAPGVPDGEARA
jgi:KDO2-lipid IV(A) lauroyltransferase